MLDVGKLTVCPLTTAVQVTNIIRPVITPSAANGLRKVSQIEVDWILTEHLRHFGPVIGSLDGSVLAQVDIALRRWLDL